MKQKRIIACPEDGLFLAGWIILSVIVLLVAIKECVYPDVNLIASMFPCYVWENFGFFCPGCGGSRSVAALLHGRLLVCAVNFPLTAYAVIMYLWFMFSHTVQRLSKNRLRIGLAWRHSYLWIALGILIAHFIIKNIYYIVTGNVPFLS